MGSTVDAREMQNFKELSPIWWGKELSGLHRMNEVRVPFVLDGLIATGTVKKELVDTSKPLEDLLILDVGCGGGFLSEALAKLGCTITAIDPCAELIEVAKQHAALDPSLSKLEYRCETTEEHFVENFEKYDVVIASEVLDHVSDPKFFLETCVKCLKPGGSIFVSTINKTTAAWLLVIVCFEYIIGILPRGTHLYEKFIIPEDTQKILKNYNCRTRTVSGLFYNVFTGRWSQISSKSFIYALHAVKV